MKHFFYTTESGKVCKLLEFTNLLTLKKKAVSKYMCKLSGSSDYSSFIKLQLLSARPRLRLF